MGYSSYISDPGDVVACNSTHTCNSFCLFSISTVTFQRGTYVCKFTRAGLRAFPRRLFCQHFCTCLCFKRFHFSCSVDCYISTLIIFSLVEVRKWTPMGTWVWFQTNDVCWAWPWCVLQGLQQVWSSTGALYMSNNNARAQRWAERGQKPSMEQRGKGLLDLNIVM